jgi:hypothetical protein
LPPSIKKARNIKPAIQVTEKRIVAKFIGCRNWLGAMGEVKPEYEMWEHSALELYIDTSSPMVDILMKLELITETLKDLDMKNWIEKNPEKTLAIQCRLRKSK